MASYNYVCIVRLAIHSIPHEISVGRSYMGTMLNFVKFEKVSHQGNYLLTQILLIEHRLPVQRS